MHVCLCVCECACMHVSEISSSSPLFIKWSIPTESNTDRNTNPYTQNVQLLHVSQLKQLPPEVYIDTSGNSGENLFTILRILSAHNL